MIQYISTRGGIDPVGFDTAVLEGFAKDGGLFVPDRIPRIPEEALAHLSTLSYTDLAYEITSLFIDPEIIPPTDLKRLIDESFEQYEHPDLIPLVPLTEDENLVIMELFHGPTQSFKDIAMGFLVNVVDYLLARSNEHLNIILATTGDTGPAAAFASAGKKCIDCWPLYPDGMISPEQERQMTTLNSTNVHPYRVKGCKNSGDDLDVVVADLFSKPDIKEQLSLSSVNSINWCRVMFQAVHHAYGYFKVCTMVGEPVDFCIPSGAFGNMFAGFLAKSMGIPIGKFICANNANQTLHRAISTGLFVQKDLIQTVSSAIDIVLPYNFWRFLYFISGSDSQQLTRWMDEFGQNGQIQLNEKTRQTISESFTSCSVSDQATLATIKETWENENYLLDPHGAVALAGARAAKAQIPVAENRFREKIVCFATAHPAKFPDVIQRALGVDTHADLPDQAFHRTMVDAAKMPENKSVCDLDHLETSLIKAMINRL